MPDIVLTRARGDVRARSHLPADPATPPGGLEQAWCGRTVRDPERVPLAVTDPADRCVACSRRVAELEHATRPA